MSFTRKKNKFLFVSLTFILCGVVVYYVVLPFFNNAIVYDSSLTNPITQNTQPLLNNNIPISSAEPIVEIPVTHIATPDQVKAVYMSSWVAGSQKYSDPIIKMVDDTELNAVVIDVKDSTGRISFSVDDKELAQYGSVEKRIANIRALTTELHQKNIYIIGRIAVFQDPYLTKLKPEWSIKKKSDGSVWKDHKGLSFLDPTNVEVQKYIVALALDAYKNGFDEINFDYIRYPSDGNMKDINYNLKKGETRADNLESFFKYISQEIKKDQNIPMSADLFGLTTEATDDMGIGQVWERALPYFDFLAPMVYPSHYPPGQDGYKNPALYPYQIINKALAGAVLKTKAVIPTQDIKKIRPWLQDFDLGAVYTKDLIKAEMKAVYDNGLSSWMLWDPKNKYTPSALELETPH